MILSVTAPVTKLCPYKDEVDEGTVEISYWVMADDDGPELHDLATKLRAFADQKLSHEAFTRKVASWDADFEITRVVSTWKTAGMDIVCAVPR